MSQVKRTKEQRSKDLSELIKGICIHEDPHVVLIALQAAAAQVIFTFIPDHKHMEAAEVHDYLLKSKLVGLRSGVKS